MGVIPAGNRNVVMLRQWLLVITLVVAAFLRAFASDTPPTAFKGEPYESLKVFTEALSHVESKYVDKVAPRDLVRRAISGMQETVRPTGSPMPPELSSVLERLAKVEGMYESLKVFLEAFKLTESQYAGKVMAKDLAHRAIRGMLNGTDPHGSFIPPETFTQMPVETQGYFGATGLEISVKDRMLTVVAPIEGTPADRAGILPGDRIIRIEGQPTKDLTLMNAVRKLRGPKGSKVTISILREGAPEPMEITLVREVIEVKSIRSKDLGDGIHYVRVISFQERTAKDLERVLEQAQKAGSSALILDLRNNPGGLLNQAVAVSDMFLDKGQLIVYTQGRLKNQDLRFTAEHSNGLPKLPMVVLVDGATAAGAEILVAALQDWKRAVVLGTATAGRGTIQTVIPLSDGSVLKLTTARFLTPNGRSIEGKGIMPDVVVGPLPNERGQASQGLSSRTSSGDIKSDVHLQRALEILKARQK